MSAVVFAALLLGGPSVRLVSGDARLIHDAGGDVIEWTGRAGSVETLLLAAPGFHLESLDVEAVLLDHLPPDCARVQSWRDRVAAQEPRLRVEDVACQDPAADLPPTPVTVQPAGKGLFALRIGPYDDGRGARGPKRVLARIAASTVSPAIDFPRLRSSSLDIHVSGRGRVQVPTSALLAHWANPSLAGLALVSADGPLPLHVEDRDGDGRLSSPDVVELYAPWTESPFTPTRGFRLFHDEPALALRMETVAASGGPPALGPWSASVARAERNTYNAFVKNGDSDNFFWALGWRTNPSTVSFDAPSVDPASPATLTLQLHGYTFYAAIDPDHHVRAVLNGQPIGDALFDGAVAHEMTVAVPAGLLQPTSNQLTLELPADTGAGVDYVYLDAMRLDYARAAAPAASEARFDVGVPAGTVFAAGPFAPSDRPVAMDVSDPLRPRRQEIALDGLGMGSAAFSGPPGTLAVHVSVSPLFPDSVVTTRGAALLTRTDGADLLLIAPKEFLDAAEILAAAREAEGLRVRIVRTDDAFGAFAFGEPTPQAIRELISHALATWDSPPRHVLLLGDGTYDYRADLAGGSLPVNRSWIPVKLFESEFTETANDNWFVDFDDDDLPDLSLGRIPAATPEEARWAVEKLIAYGERPFRSWGTRAVFVSDNAEQSWEQYYFDDLTDTLAAALPPWMEPVAIPLGELGAAATKARVREEVENGAVWVNYLGHGSTRLWAQEQILDAAGATSLSNADRPAAFVSLTCNNAQFQQPNVSPSGVDQRSLGELLLFAEGGAIAFWGETTYGYPDPLPSVSVAAIERGLSGEVVRLGDVTLHAKRAIDVLSFGWRDIARGLTLLGDPTLLLHNNHFPEARPVAEGMVTTGGWTPLDGTTSADPDAGQSLEHRWRLLAAPPGSEAAISSEDEARTRLWPDLPGEYVVSLEVSDGLSWSAPANVAIVASGPPAPRPRARPDPIGCNAGREGSPAGALGALAVAAVLVRRRRPRVAQSADAESSGGPIQA